MQSTRVKRFRWISFQCQRLQLKNGCMGCLSRTHPNHENDSIAAHRCLHIFSYATTLQDFEAAIDEKTKAVYIESVANPAYGA